ncbi:MAG: tlde1 domain-containing protein [Microvirga sp.]
MAHRYTSSGRHVRRRSRRSLFTTSLLVAISLSPLAYFADLRDKTPEATASLAPLPKPAPQIAAASPQPANVSPLFDPAPALKLQTFKLAHHAPSPTAFSILGTPKASADPVIAAIPQKQPDEIESEEEMKTAEVIAIAPIPLPVPRPPEFRFQSSPEPRQMASAAVPATRRSAAQPDPVQPAVPSDDRSFFEKLFGVKPASPPDAALSYAALDRGTGSINPTARFGSPFAPEPGTAVYDISAKIVYMPNGDKLEAHSGLGDKLDDPRHVNVRMKGATPPGTYVLTEREALFHGVRAIRMNPVGGSAAIYGRDGILAHTYMLGPRGDSNGCVSFKDYNKFLEAYLRGEVKRMVVTAGRGQDLLPRIVNNRTGRSARDI